MRSWSLALALIATTVGCLNDAPPVEDTGGTSSTAGTSETGTTTATTTITTSSPDTGSESTSSGPVGVCTGDQECIARAPDDWMGPYVFATIDDPNAATCPRATTGPLVLHANLDDTPPACDCVCEQATGTCTAAVSSYTDTSCNFSLAMMPNLDPGDCRPLDAADAYAQLGPGLTNAGDCAPDDKTAYPAFPWLDHARACAAMPELTCDGGVCLPVGGDDVCIIRDGTHACPVDEGWTKSATWFLAADDTRSCHCSCGMPHDVGCTGQAWAYPSADCSGDATQWSAIECIASSGASWSLNWMPDSPGQCDGMSALAGDLVESGKQTVCCL